MFFFFMKDSGLLPIGKRNEQAVNANFVGGVVAYMAGKPKRYLTLNKQAVFMLPTKNPLTYTPWSYLA
jgi:hypothetical protein